MARFSTPTQNNERVKTEWSRGRLWKVTVVCVSQNSLNQDGLSQNGYGGVYGVYGASAVVFFISMVPLVLAVVPMVSLIFEVSVV